MYYNNLVSREDLIAEACSHEMGHNLGLSHDGVGGVNPTVNKYLVYTFAVHKHGPILPLKLPN